MQQYMLHGDKEPIAIELKVDGKNGILHFLFILVSQFLPNISCNTNLLFAKQFVNLSQSGWILPFK